MLQIPVFSISRKRKQEIIKTSNDHESMTKRTRNDADAEKPFAQHLMFVDCGVERNSDTPLVEFDPTHNSWRWNAGSSLSFFSSVVIRLANDGTSAFIIGDDPTKMPAAANIARAPQSFQCSQHGPLPCSCLTIASLAAHARNLDKEFPIQRSPSGADIDLIVQPAAKPADENALAAHNRIAVLAVRTDTQPATATFQLNPLYPLPPWRLSLGPWKLSATETQQTVARALESKKLPSTKANLEPSPSILKVPRCCCGTVGIELSRCAACHQYLCPRCISSCSNCRSPFCADCSLQRREMDGPFIVLCLDCLEALHSKDDS